LSVARTLVTTLLISSIIMGFVQGLSTQTASGVITTTATTTSTYYSTWYGTATSTQYVTTTQWTDYVMEMMNLGPYVRVEGKWYLVTLTTLRLDFIIMNLKDLPITNGYVDIGVQYVVGSKEMGGMGFAKFSVTGNRKEIPVQTTVEITPYPVPLDPYTTHIKEVWIVSVRLQLSESRPIESVIPLATYTLTRTETNTYLATYTATLMLSETQVFFSSTGRILLFLAVTGVAIGICIWGFSRRKAPTPERKEETPEKPSPKEEIPTKPSVQDLKTSVQTETVSKFCRHCGAKIPKDSMFCESCGKKL